MRWLGGALVVLVLGCSFESTSGQDPAFNPSEGSTSAPGSTGDADPATTGNQSGSAEGTTATAPDPSTGSSPSTTAPSEESGDRATTTGDASATAEETGSAGVDCGEPRVFSMLAEDAALTPPMQLGEYMSVSYAYSNAANSGDAVFTFDVDCPSMYRLFARVRDDDPGISNCCDPDSFIVQGPGGIDISWFYGCDTTAAGWTWARVASGQVGQTCADTVPLVVPLTPGTHQFTLHNRESNYFDAVAGVAELVLTNDPEYIP